MRREMPRYFCNGAQNAVLEVREERRRRECTACRHRWTTFEVPAERLELLERLEGHAAAIAQELERGGD
jgi:transcriptional regulator NrdR family protein